MCVCYHEDCYTKNKHVSDPMRGLFLTCTENSFYSAHTHKTKRVCILLFTKGNVLLAKAIPCSWQWIPHPLSSLAWSQLPLRPLHFPHPPHPLTSNRAFILHKDNIIKPNSSVGHNVYISTVHASKKKSYFWLKCCKCFAPIEYLDEHKHLHTVQLLMFAFLYLSSIV